MRKSSAFTLVEVLISITIFVIFMGMSLGAYLTFHRAQLEASITRGMMLEGEQIMNVLTTAVKENRVAYSAYEPDNTFNSVIPVNFSLFSLPEGAIETDTLILSELDSGDELEIHWDAEEEILTQQWFTYDDGGERIEAAGYLEPLRMHSESVNISFAEFRIVPGRDPYDAENILGNQEEYWYQPMVQIKFTVKAKGAVREEILFDLQTSVTSRVYQ
ncbi:MAG: prepilin-type N-terminal cleavage/methylation domain-containing protein [Patescibacteria group bacterium]